MAAPPSGGTSIPPGNGSSQNGSKGVIAGAFDLSSKLITALPPAFLMLMLMNVIFMGIVMWFLNSQMHMRVEMIEALMNKCLNIALKSEPPT